MVAALDDYLNRLYPPQFNHLLDIETLCGPDIRFFLATVDGVPVGCCALRVDASGYGELKRMYALPEARGRGIGRAMMARLEVAARAEGLKSLRLETGALQSEAVGLYEACGFARCDPFADYEDNGVSLFLEKRL